MFVEGITDKKYLNKAIELFKQDSNIKYIIENVDGKDNLNKIYNALPSSKCKHLLKNNKIILLYDNDVTKKNNKNDKTKAVKEETNGNIHKIIMSENINNTTIKNGIENSLNVDTIFKIVNKEDFYYTKTIYENDGGETILKKLDKSKLCDYICDKLDDIEKQKEVLEPMNKILDIIEEVFKV